MIVMNAEKLTPQQPEGSVTLSWAPSVPNTTADIQATVNTLNGSGRRAWLISFGDQPDYRSIRLNIGLLLRPNVTEGSGGGLYIYGCIPSGLATVDGPPLQRDIFTIGAYNWLEGSTSLVPGLSIGESVTAIIEPNGDIEAITGRSIVGPAFGDPVVASRRFVGIADIGPMTEILLVGGPTGLPAAISVMPLIQRWR